MGDLLFLGQKKERIDHKTMKPPKILFKYPSRGRPEQFIHTLNLYYDHLSFELPFMFLITLDEDDETMNNEGTRRTLDMYKNLGYYYGRSENKIDAVNRDMDIPIGDWDILVLVSDDMIPQKEGLDKIIVNDMNKYFLDGDGFLHYNDGYTQDKLCTLSVMSKKYYDRFGYIYYPSYKSFFCDNEQTEIAKRMGRYKYIDNVIIKHEHPANNQNIPTDEMYKQNDENWAHDKAIFEEREKLNFGL